MQLYELVNKYHVGTTLSCAEAMFKACNEYYGLNLPENTRKMFSIMGIGMQTQLSCCGAFTVAVGIIGLVTAQDGQEDSENFHGYSMVTELTDFVIEKFGTLQCATLHDMQIAGYENPCHLIVEEIAKKLEELQIPLIITATDLDHGRLVHFHKGDIAERVAASCCMPVLFAPVNIDGTHYVDGGLLMNLPVSTLRRICEKVIAVNVSPLMATKYKMNIVSIALRSYNFMFRSNSFPEREKADLLIEPYNLEGYSNTELEKAEEIFMQGYNTTNDILERLLIDKGSIWKE